MLELANISPPIGSKLRKVYSAIQTKKFNQAAIDEMGYDLTRGGRLNPSPNYEIIANIASAVGNLPLDRLLSEVKSINEAFDSRNTSYQRLALALGWRTWDVNVKNEEQDLIKNEAKKRKKEASKQRAKDKRDIKSREKRRKKNIEAREKRERDLIKKLYF
jgi:polyribonucleotide nucleotidyltransferase